MSPKKKKPRISNPASISNLKRDNCAKDSPNKRRKSETNRTDDLQSLRRKNFIKACELVSFKAYTNHAERFLLVYMPHCISSSVCKHEVNNKSQIKPITNHIEEIFNIEMKSNMWLEALEVCNLCITPSQYLSADVLKSIVEIIMNAHEDSSTACSVSHVINQCQQILRFNFSMHPPCLMKSIRKCYENFLTSPMDHKENTFTNRSEFDYKEGIVKYCMNRLEYELSAESKDEPLINKYENIPEEMKQSVKGLHWQKEKLEIFELLERPDRIERLMTVLHSIIELLQFDLAIWHSRYTNNLGNHIMRSHKPLMAYVLWSNNVLYTGAVNKNCSQILRIFSYIVHLQYSEDHIKIMTLWVNAMIQTFYLCENNSSIDYPNTGKYCTAFANKFYTIIKDLPHESIIKILERIQPSFMRHIIGMIHVKTLLPTDSDNCIEVLINFLDGHEWEQLPGQENDILVKKTVNIKNIKPNKFLKLLSNKCKESQKLPQRQLRDNCYQKFFICESRGPITRNYVFHVLYVTFQAYLDAFSVFAIQEKLDLMNEQLENAGIISEDYSKPASYVVTENFIKKNRQIFQLMKELVVTLNKVQESSELINVKKMFENLLKI